MEEKKGRIGERGSPQAAKLLEVLWAFSFPLRKGEHRAGVRKLDTAE